MNTQKNKCDILAERIEEIINNPGSLESPLYLARKAIDEYRASEWTLGRSINGHTLAEGQEWHRNDWTEDMLPEGWRPLLKGEMPTDGTQKFDENKWSQASLQQTTITAEGHMHMRTKRQLPVLTPAQIADGWLEWHGGECPVWDRSMPNVMFRDGDAHDKWHAGVMEWNHIGTGRDIVAYRPDPYAAFKKAHSEGKVIQVKDRSIGGGVSWYDLTVKCTWNEPPEAYRVKPAPVMVPLSQDDVKCGDEIKAIKGNQNRIGIIEVSPLGVYTHRTENTWLELQSHCLIDRHDGKGFVRCEKEAK